VWLCSNHYRETTCPRRSDLISPAATYGATGAGPDVVPSSGRRPILGIDLASPTQAAVLADHESSGLSTAMFSGKVLW